MTPEINAQISEILDRYQPLTESAVERVRVAAVMSADMIASSKRPIDAVTAATLRLNKISHESLAKLVKAQSDMIEAAVDAFAKHLNTAADARSWKELVDAQVALVPTERDRIVKDARRTLEVFSDARDEVKDVFAAGDKLVTKTRKRAATTASKARKTASTSATKARRTARKTTAKARKAAGGAARRTRATAKKPTARKTTTRRTRKAA